MKVQSSIETDDFIIATRHLISASIETKHKDNLIGAVDTYNETILVLCPSIDKNHFVLEGDDLKIEAVDVWIGHIDLASEDMIPIKVYSPNEHLSSILCHPEYIGVQTGYSESSSKNSMPLFPSNSSGVVEHEQIINCSHHHMRGVHKISILDVLSTDHPWEEHAEGSGIDQLEPAITSKA